MLERKCLFAEQFTPPAFHRGNVGLVVGGDPVEVVDGCNDLGSDAVPFGGHPQQNLKQLDCCSAVYCRTEAFQVRQRLLISLKPALDRIDDLLAPTRTLKTLRQ